MVPRPLRPIRKFKSYFRKEKDLFMEIQEENFFNNYDESIEVYTKDIELKHKFLKVDDTYV